MVCDSSLAINFWYNTKEQGKSTIKINQTGLHPLKTFCIVKETMERVRKKPLEWEDRVANRTPDKELPPK